jgi:hypothetical protein
MKKKYNLNFIFLQLILLYFIPVPSGYCQVIKQQLLPGAIITLTNDTLKGMIKNGSELDMQFRVEFYSESGVKTVYKPTIINGYYLIKNGELSCYESFRYPKAFYFLNRNFFLKKIVDGKTALYLYKEVGYNFWGVGKTVYYYYFLKENGTWINTKPITAYNLNRQLKLFLKDCEPLLKEIETKKLFIDELPDLIQKHNKFCT